MTRIGIILHAPEIIDVGSAKRIIDIFRQGHEVISKPGGNGRTASCRQVLNYTRAQPGFDDIVGQEVFEKLMHNRQQISAWNIDEFPSRVTALAKKHIVNMKNY